MNSESAGKSSPDGCAPGMEPTKRIDIDTREVLRAQADLLEQTSHAVVPKAIVPVHEQAKALPAKTGSRAVGQPTQSQQSWWRRYGKPILVAGITALIVTIIVTVAVLVNAVRNPATILQRTPTAAQPTPGGPQGSHMGGVVEPVETPPNYTFDAEHINILILGTDLSKKRQEQGMNARTDTIMLLSVNLDNNKINLISIPRDTYTRVYNAERSLGYYGKINAAFAYGGGLSKDGVAYATNTVSHFLGSIPIDYYVSFDMDLVKELVDSIGGLRYEMDLDVTISGKQFTPGWTTLDGAAVLRYARHRHSSGGDFGRVDRQQKIIVALFEQLKSNRQLSSVPKLYEALQDNITTDLDALQIAALAWFAMDIELTDITRYTIPGSTMTVNGSDIVVANQTEKANILKEIFGIDVPFRAEESASYMQRLIKEAYSSGQSVVSTAKVFLSNSARYFTSDEAKGLNSAISAWNSAYRRRDAEEMSDCQLEVETEYNVLYGIVKTRKAAVGVGEEKIGWAKSGLSKYADYLSDGDRGEIQTLIGTVQRAMNNRDYNAIASAADRLESGAKPIFSRAKEAQDTAGVPTPSPSEEPTAGPSDTISPTPTPTPTESKQTPVVTASPSATPSAIGAGDDTE